MTKKKAVLMVCLGNICRSPIAEAIFDDKIKKKGLTDQWEVDSAALIGYHTGKSPDPRAVSVLREKGITNYSHSARQITLDDFHKYDWIFGMDYENLKVLTDMKPQNSKAVVDMLGKYDPLKEIIIRDPYYDNHNDGFKAVFDQCTRCIIAFLEKYEGNSCRSPIAEAVFNEQIKQMNLLNYWEADSAAILKYHIGNPPEPRAMSTLHKHGITEYSHIARLVRTFDVN